jgi:hypothetical protein
MDVLVVLNKKRKEETRVLVRMAGTKRKSRLLSLMKKDQLRDAFDFVLHTGLVKRHIHPGARLSAMPEITFIEDLL